MKLTLLTPIEIKFCLKLGPLGILGRHPKFSSMEQPPIPLLTLEICVQISKDRLKRLFYGCVTDSLSFRPITQPYKGLVADL